MEFLQWWFDKHYIFSTIITTEMTLAWCAFNGLIWRGLFCIFLILLEGWLRSKQ